MTHRPVPETDRRGRPTDRLSHQPPRRLPQPKFQSEPLNATLNSAAIALLGILALLAGQQICLSESPSGLLSLNAGVLTVGVDPHVGGRVASFKHGQHEALRTQRDADHFHWGSTVWIGPQSDWKWPPSSTIDSQPYKVVRHDDHSIKLESEIDPETKLQLIKTFGFESDHTEKPVLVARYELINRGDSVREAGLWENTRVDWRGTVACSPSKTVRSSPKDDVIHLEATSPTFSLNEHRINGQKIFITPKVGLDELTLSHRYRGYQLIKRWRRPTRVAPGQAEIEIYFGRDKGFCELENHGVFAKLLPNQTVRLVTRWTIETLP